MHFICKSRFSCFAGIDGLAAEHFVYSHSSVSAHLALVFTCMLNHGRVPTAFMKTSIIPILRNRNGDKNNYRPIAIVTAMSKLFNCVYQNCWILS